MMNYNQDNPTEVSNQTILVIDDDESIRTLLEVMLSQEGFNVISAGDGQEALIKADEERPALVLVDENLSGASGVELTGRLKAREETKGIPVIALTSYLPPDVENNLEKSGFCCHVEKPFDKDGLLRAVRENIRL